MKSSYALAALVGFALLNTAFLGAYLYSSSGVANELSSPASQTLSSTSYVPAQTATVTATNTMATTVVSMSSTTTTAPAVQSISSNSTSTTATPTATSAISGTAPATANSMSKVSGFSTLSLLQFFEIHSLALAPGSWAAVGGMWIWRGRMKSRWRDFGFDSDVFGLFVKMKGGKTRIRLLDALSLPKDRLQLAQELGLDWKGVDRHLVLMKKYGFVDDRVVYGKVRMYQLTPMGSSLLKLLQELSREERREAPSQVQPYPDQGV